LFLLFHSLEGFAFAFCFSSGGYPLPGCCFRLDPDGPKQPATITETFGGIDENS
jgi:hypothetical protein